MLSVSLLGWRCHKVVIWLLVSGSNDLGPSYLILTVEVAGTEVKRLGHHIEVVVILAILLFLVQLTWGNRIIGVPKRPAQIFSLVHCCPVFGQLGLFAMCLLTYINHVRTELSLSIALRITKDVIVSSHQLIVSVCASCCTVIVIRAWE